MGFFSKVSAMLGSGGTQAEASPPEAAVRLQLHDSWLEAVKSNLFESAQQGPLEGAIEDIWKLVRDLEFMAGAPLDVDWKHWSPGRVVRTHSRAEELAEAREKEAELRKPIVVVGDSNDPENCGRYGLRPSNEINPDNVWATVQEAGLGLRAAGYPKAIKPLVDTLGTTAWQLERGASGETEWRSRVPDL